MWRLYRKQSTRLRLWRGYRMLITHSSHMQSELLRHGFSPKVVHRIPYAVDLRILKAQAAQVTAVNGNAIRNPDEPWRLLFLGRMDFLKGGLALMDALPSVTHRLSRDVRLTFGGDGPDRETWAQRAAQVTASCARVGIEFAGWLDESGIDELLLRSDLLVVPSLWPEPFGRVGPRAGLRSVPVAAFAAGGIPEWLTDGVNGFLAPADPPAADGLADAIVRCLEDPAVYNSLRYGALKEAQRFSMSNHLSQLMPLFESACALPQTL